MDVFYARWSKKSGVHLVRGRIIERFGIDTPVISGYEEALCGAVPPRGVWTQVRRCNEGEVCEDCADIVNGAKYIVALLPIQVDPVVECKQEALF